MENLVIDPDFWNSRKVFLTGHTGFKGGWLTLWLTDLGAEVSGYALMPGREPCLYPIAAIGNLVNQSTRGDIRDPDLLTSALQAAQPEIVIHMAAQSLVGLGYDDPVATFSTNVMGTVNLFEAIRSTPSVKAVLNITSDKCYENDGRLNGFNENDSMGGRDPYSASKGCSELVSTAYRKSYFQLLGVATASARAGNVIGGGDWAERRIVPDAVRAFTSDQPLIIRSPASVRPWQHVLEPLSGYLMLCQALLYEPDSYSSGWNFGPDKHESKTVGELANGLVQAWGGNASWKPEPGTHLHEEPYLTLDCSKAQSLLGWAPVLNLEKTISQSLAWYKAWQAGENMQAFSLAQIREYQSTLRKAL